MAEGVVVIADLGVQLITKYTWGGSKSRFIDLAHIQVRVSKHS
jgi:hypothetical protein